MANVRRSPRAEIDLDAILGDLDEKNPKVAERYAADFAEKGALLAQFPEIGRARPEIAPDLRSVLVYPYVMFYRIRDGDVEILRILPGRMDLRRIMREEMGE